MWRIKSWTILVTWLSLFGCNDVPGGGHKNADGGRIGTPGSDQSVFAAVAADDRWLHTDGNKIYTADNQVWIGRGANIQDTRGCDACTYAPPEVDEVKRRVDVLIDEWKANFIRLTLESYATADGRIHFAGVLDDAAYLDDIAAIVAHIQSKGAYVMVSLWNEPTLSTLGWPTDATTEIWRTLVQRFATSPQVLFGLVNAPQRNISGDHDAGFWFKMNNLASAIRSEEERLSVPKHIIVVQGTGDAGRQLDYFIAHPIAAGGGANVAYETHVYNPASDFDRLFRIPSLTLPVIIGEFGPAQGMTLDDCAALMNAAEDLNVSYLAWTFHMRCPPNLLVDSTDGAGCGIDMPIVPTDWGTLLYEQLHNSGSLPPPDEPLPTTPGWLHTSGNAILDEKGEMWVGRGANIQDTRGCNACTYAPANLNEVKRRIDILVDDWGATFVRLALESYAQSEGRVQFAGVLDDEDYLADVVNIVDHIGTKPGVYVMLSLWQDPTFTANGWPTEDTQSVWRRLTATFATYSYVLFGLVNEPEENYSGANDASVWLRMNDTVNAIRDQENIMGTPNHLVAVQGTRNWGRYVDYYVDHPITAGEGANIVYETHVYNTASDFDALFGMPSQTLPMIIGEFGPTGTMTLGDCETLIDQAEARHIPYLAWTFHMRCPPNLFEDASGGGCGIDMPIVPTDWGTLLQTRLGQGH